MSNRHVKSTMPPRQSVVDGDRWLADFLDWLDSSGDHSSDASAAEQRVENFLEDCGRDAPDGVREVLLDFVSSSEPLAELAATATLNWIESAGGPQVESLPRPFGDYLLEEVIGRGGMGIVYRATQQSLGRAVCIKLAPTGMEEQARLVREARLAGQLHHPNIVHVFDAGEQAGRSFIAMELVEGQPLSALLATRTLEAREAAMMLGQICDAIEFAHQNGILHRDLKPSNVIVDRSDRPRVTDFGLAKQLHLSSSSTTATLAGIAGSPSYMAPEQVRDEELSEATDVYGLGTILYEMLSGRPPLMGNTPLETMRLVETTEPVDVGRLQVGLPKDLETICHKCLEKRPQNRYRSVGDLVADLQCFLEGVPVQARPVNRLTRAVRWIRRNRPVSIAAAAVLVTVLASLAGLGWMLSQTSEALRKKTVAEANQRALAGQLRQAVDRSNDALYRSLIVQAAQSLSVNDVSSARLALNEIESTTGLKSLGRIEYDTLRGRAWPAMSTLGSDTGSDRSPLIDFVFCGDHDALVMLHRSGELQTCSIADGKRLAHSRLPADDDAADCLIIHPQQHFAALLTEDELRWIDPITLQVDVTLPLPEAMREVAWSRAGRSLLAISNKGGLWELDVSAGPARRLGSQQAMFRKLAVSDDGRWVALLQSGEIQVWKTKHLRAAITEQTSVRPRADKIISIQPWPID
ncbi:MAG: protein kinase, partial [Pirellulales bacterium]|nr:protein kinase [Pirellulales bacterium]